MSHLFAYPKKMFDLLMMGDSQGILFWAMIYVSIACIVSLYFQLRVAKWPSVDGNLIKLEIEGSGMRDRFGRGNCYLTAEYDYSIDSVMYKGRRISMTTLWTNKNMIFLLRKRMAAVQRLPEGKVVVFYNPKKPEKSYLLKTAMLTKALMLIIPLGFMVLFYLSSK